jgi:gag-polypeptide of LTR copia-type
MAKAQGQRKREKSKTNGMKKTNWHIQILLCRWHPWESEHDHIRGAKTALIAWNRLEELYHGKTMPRLVSLIKKLTEAKLVDDPIKATMKDYIQGVMQTSSEISEIGHKLNDPSS